MKNLYKVLNIIALVAIIALLGGCFSPWAGDGATITINVGGGSGRAVFPPDDETLAQIRYTVELQGPSNITEQLAHGTQSINLSVIPGDYTITVTARLAEGELYAISIATAVARAGQSTRVDVTMQYVGDGFIIFFDTGSGTSIDPQIVKRGEKVERPQKNPTWNIYGFVDWYSDKDLKNKFDFNIPVTSSVTSKITLYAKWNTVTHTVTFMGDDGDTLSTEVVGDGGTLPQPEDLIRNGFVFGGWYIGDDEYVFNTEIHYDITLCAMWNDPIFDDIADLGAYLSKWSDNTADTPYPVSLTVNDISTLRTTLNNNPGRYVYLDLSESNMTEIPERTFFGTSPYGCATLIGITIPNSVETIGNSAFSNCTNLASITIPDSVITIGNTFNSCNNLASITIGSGVTSVGSQAFNNCRSLTNINVSDSNTAYSAEGGVLYNIDKTTLVAYPSVTGSFTIPSGVTTIGQHAFVGNYGLNSVIMESGVANIGQAAFSACINLDSVTIGSGVTSIGAAAFMGCAKLTSITIPNSVKTIGNQTFDQCTKLTSVTFATGNNTTNIGPVAFPEGTNGNGGETLRTAYNTGKAGTYTRDENGDTWTKAP